jgi:hypothetical protein
MGRRQPTGRIGRAFGWNFRQSLRFICLIADQSWIRDSPSAINQDRHAG